MLNSFLAVYEKGYTSGLRRATAMPGEQNAFPGAVDYPADELLDVASRPAYQEGFVDGFCDGLQVLAEHPNTGLASSSDQTSPFMIEIVNITAVLRRKLNDFFYVSRRHSDRIEDSTAQLQEALGRAEAVITSFPEEGTEAFLVSRWVYVQLVSLVKSAHQALA